MKCPFRSTTTRTVENQQTKKVVTEVIEFPSCYGNDCPYYQINGKCTRELLKEQKYIKKNKKELS